ncbi:MULTISPECIES: hypothetical protein [Vibrio]|uniref:Lipoprotein n=2 Tax=Vibrio tasmaniensis TaxID=212663 RepID=A0A2N7NBQ2_9VIBR|nr:hypothetical protein [Vibrio tasmaniensis]OEF54017.1 hypothetical protein A163_16290 [Vibrio tasmaniensis 1F-267]PMP08118.1 hypothetical protein BCS92_03390 [Vibrio tasmaniensis]TKG36742.1 hypothetical protein FC057_02340 [Vibrio tasmaniensis]TKG38716.1 hypothetical protein FC063_19100 [Vibrio tasmaniensis]TKG44089.1 hypothetical protein FC061_21800 [Vibrio tasmaniensis]
MKNTMLLRTTLVSSIALALTACGGGGGTNPGTPSAQIAGVAIDGYVEGATAFLDYNFNGVQDDNEPSSTTDQNGRFDFAIEEDDLICKEYSPIIVNVPTGAYDSDYGLVNKPYSLTFPPSFSSDNVGEDVFATTPFTTVIWSAVETDLLQSGVSNCKELAANTEAQNKVVRLVAEKEYELGNRYNIPANELYADFIASGNTEQHQLAQLLTSGLAKGYAETSALVDANPNAWKATVEYYVEKDDAGNFTKWYREERVFDADTHSLRVFEVSVDLETVGRLIVYRNKIKAEEGAVQKYTDDLIDYLPEISKYGCGLTNDYVQNSKNYGNDTVTFSVSASVLVDDHTACADTLVYSSSVPYANVIRELKDGNVLLQAGMWGFDFGDDAVINDLINDGLYSNITDPTVLDQFSTWNYSLDSTESYDASRWTRTSVVSTAEKNVITDVNSKGIWIVRTTYPNGTHQTQCGDSLDTLVDVAHMGGCEELPIVPAN